MKINLIIFSYNDLIQICKLENISYDSDKIDSILTIVCEYYELNMGIICVKKKNENDIQDRISYMYYNNQVFKSDNRKHTPKEDIGGGDSYVASIIDSLLSGDTDMNNILNSADLYTIQKQENRGNFNLS